MPKTDELPPLKDLLQTALANRSDLAAERLASRAARSRRLEPGTESCLYWSRSGRKHRWFGGYAENVVSRRESRPPIPTSMAESAMPSARYFAVTSRPIGRRILSDSTRQQSGASRLRDRSIAAPPIADPVGQGSQPGGGGCVELCGGHATGPRALSCCSPNATLAAAIVRCRTKQAGRRRIHTVQRSSAAARLVTAQSAEIAALVDFSNARVALDQTLGKTLEANQVSIDDARSGRVQRVSYDPRDAEITFASNVTASLVRFKVVSRGQSVPYLTGSGPNTVIFSCPSERDTSEISAFGFGDLLAS